MEILLWNSKENKSKIKNLPDDGDANDKTVVDGTYWCWHAHNFEPPNVDVETGQLIESSYPIRLNRLLH